MIDLNKLMLITVPYYSNDYNEAWKKVRICPNRLHLTSRWGSEYYLNHALKLGTFEPPKSVQTSSPCKLYILSDCKINREFLRNSGYTITRSAEKADLVVLPKITYKQNIDNHRFLYSKTNDTWYLIDPSRINRSWVQDSLHASNNSIENLFLAKIKSINLVPHDTTYVDTKGSTWIKSGVVAEFFKKDTSNMKFIYDSELSTFLNTDNILDIDTMQHIDTMLKSNGEICAMGMKLMSTFNPSTNMLPLLALIQFNGNGIRHNSAKNSIAFKSLMNSVPEINMDHYNPLLNFAKYFETCENTDQKIIVHQYLKSQILEEINNATNRYRDICTKYGLTINFNVDGWLDSSQSQD